MLRAAKIKINIIDLKYTFFLNTAIIDSEWINNLNKDIFDGPKYRAPRIDFISLKFSTFFLECRIATPQTCG